MSIEQAEVDAVALHERAAARAATAGRRTRPTSGCTIDARCGKSAAITGRAISSVTRPPPCGAAADRAGRRSPSRTAMSGRVSSGPRSPTTKCGPKSRMSASHHTMRSPCAAATDLQSASPLPSPGPSSGSTSSTASTRAPAAGGDASRGVGRVVVDHEHLVDQPAAFDQVARSCSTIGPTVAASSRAGRHTRHDVAAARLLLGQGRSAEVAVPEGPEDGPPHGAIQPADGRAATHAGRTSRAPGFAHPGLISSDRAWRLRSADGNGPLRSSVRYHRSPTSCPEEPHR